MAVYYFELQNYGIFVPTAYVSYKNFIPIAYICFLDNYPFKKIMTFKFA